ncbi:hypothetical protein [Stenotrophomonas nematodicola]|uniref:hypothetical protein n=1 Tax=Stenotrophomonas nematodicola TaxID=2656746 RepID=UPI003D9A77CE
MAKKKGQRRGAAIPRSVEEPKNQGGEPTWKKWAYWLGLASGWIVSALLGLLALPEKIVSFSSHLPAARETTLNALRDYPRYVGRFSSDPEAWKELNLLHGEEPMEDGGEIQLSIEYEGDGRYVGEIHSSYMATHFIAPWSLVMLDGRLGATGDFRGEVWDIVRNQRAVYARFQLRVEDKQKGTLRLIPENSDDGVFPGEVVLWPTDFAMSEGVRGTKFQEMLAEGYKRYQAEQRNSELPAAKEADAKGSRDAPQKPQP